MQNPFPYFDGFTYDDALPYEEGVTKRDPSPVIYAKGEYYVWYSRTTESPDGYTASVWYATSKDGIVWKEQGEAIPKGDKGAFDEHAVFTPTILTADGKYYLFYTAVPEPFTNDNGGPNATRTAIGAAVADSPDGPWTRCASEPVLPPSDDPNQFDSMRVDDSCIVVREGQFWMYYKGRQMNRTPRETKMGVAIASSPTGPYIKHEQNPILDSGHEVCTWPHASGVGSIVAGVGPQGNTLQYSEDGIHFSKIKDITPPQAPGPYRADAFSDEKGPGITWGIAMKKHPQWPYLVRFECNLRPPEEKSS